MVQELWIGGLCSSRKGLFDGPGSTAGDCFFGWALDRERSSDFTTSWDWILVSLGTILGSSLVQNSFDII